MSAKQIAKRALQAPAVASALRWVNTNPALSEDTRHRMYLKVTKKIPPSGADFTHKLLDRHPITLQLEGTLRELYWTGEYEADTLPLFVRYAAGASSVLDIGAADGVYSIFAAAVSPEARILAFEPGLRQLERMRHNISANAALVGDRIEVIEAALSDHDGTAEFHESASEGDSSLNAEFRPGSVARTVTVARGDAVVAERLAGRTVDLIKIDTESTEPDVLRGLHETVGRDQPVIFCEVLAGRTEDRLQALVDGWGYRTWWLGADGPVARDRIDGDPNNRYVNWLFLPDGRQPLTS
ncbi:MAG: hypothetical protein JWO77_1529 [Ilumatobacteraceae bacterium]|nr:hypothetical protein [Ilumatobacteraceae bacterium]